MHPKLGASWEGFALEEILRSHQPDEAYFYAVHSGCELDLLMFLRGRKVGVEFKRADAPKLTRSMQTVLADLDLDELWVIYPGTATIRWLKKLKLCRWGNASDPQECRLSESAQSQR